MRRDCMWLAGTFIPLLLTATSLGGAVAAGREGDSMSGPPSLTWTDWKFQCRGRKDAEASWRSVRGDANLRRVLALARKLPIRDFGEGYPTTCQLAVSERCSPDFDGDGKEDAFMRMTWVVPTGPGPRRCPAGAALESSDRNDLIFAVRSQDKSVQTLWYTFSEDGAADLRFGKLSNGTPVVILEKSLEESDSGCVKVVRDVLDLTKTSFRTLFTTEDRSNCSDQ